MDAKTTSIKGACPHDCPDQCGWEVVVDNGRAIDVVGAQDHPFTDGTLCTKLKRFPDRVYSPDRILFPMRRVGTKGSGQFARTSWEVAIADIAERLRHTIDAHGATSVMPYSFAGTIGLLQRNAGALLFRHLGATGVLGDYCGAVAKTGVDQTIGPVVGVLPEDMAHSRYIVLWGTNTAVTNLHLWSTVIRKARQNGAKLVVIDPVRTQTAAHADHFIQIKPGTDAALALGLMHVLIAEEIFDADYVQSYTVGFDELRQRVADYTPAHVARLTGIPESEIRQLARNLATEKPAVIRLLVGMERHRFGEEAFRAISCIPALTGAWRELGGGLCHFTVDLFRQSLNYDAIFRTEDVLLPPRSIHIAQLGQALTGNLDPSIHCLFVYNANPVVAAPNQNLVVQGLQREDLFTVVHEQFMTNTAKYADYVLPATTQIEHLDLMPSWGQTYLALNKPAIAPVGEAIANTELYRRIAAELDLKADYLYTDDESMVRALLDSDHPYLSGITYERLERDGWAHLNLQNDWRPLAKGGFETRSGKCEFFSQTLADNGFDPLPSYTPPPSGNTYPLQLISAKTASHALNTQYINLQRSGVDRQPVIDINVDDAAGREIHHGDKVRVFNHLGEVFVTANVCEHTRPGIVSLAFNWWPSSMMGGSSANALTEDGLTAKSMGSDAFDTFVEVTTAN